VARVQECYSTTNNPSIHWLRYPTTAFANLSYEFDRAGMN
jgi:hypothetical protein